MKKWIILLGIFCVFAVILKLNAPSVNTEKVFSSDENKIYIFERKSGDHKIRFLTYEDNPQSRIWQSFIYVNKPEIMIATYPKLMLQALSFFPDPKKILILGLGGGLIPGEISTYFPDTKIDIVELKPEIPYVAEKYFNFKKTANINIFIEDAFKFVIESKSANYDIIFMDVFDETYIPQIFLQDKFFAKLKNMLSKKGVLAVNTFIDSKTLEQEEELILRHFTFASQITKSNNIIFVSDSPLVRSHIPGEFAKKIDFEKYIPQEIKNNKENGKKEN